jgi:hypothetical protein
VLDGCPIAEEENYRRPIFKLIPSLEYIDGEDNEGNAIELSESESCSKELEPQDNLFKEIDNELLLEDLDTKKELTCDLCFDNQLAVTGNESLEFKSGDFESGNFNGSTKDDLFDFPFDDYKAEYDEGKFC